MLQIQDLIKKEGIIANERALIYFLEVLKTSFFNMAMAASD